MSTGWPTFILFDSTKPIITLNRKQVEEPQMRFNLFVLNTRPVCYDVVRCEPRCLLQWCLQIIESVSSALVLMTPVFIGQSEGRLKVNNITLSMNKRMRCAAHVYLASSGAGQSTCSQSQGSKKLLSISTFCCGPALLLTVWSKCQQNQWCSPRGNRLTMRHLGTAFPLPRRLLLEKIHRPHLYVSASTSHLEQTHSLNIISKLSQ